MQRLTVNRLPVIPLRFKMTTALPLEAAVYGRRGAERRHLNGALHHCTMVRVPYGRKSTQIFPVTSSVKFPVVKSWFPSK
jgi:hypothetical protein